MPGGARLDLDPFAPDRELLRGPGPRATTLHVSRQSANGFLEFLPLLGAYVRVLSDDRKARLERLTERSLHLDRQLLGDEVRREVFGGTSAPAPRTARASIIFERSACRMQLRARRSVRSDSSAPSCRSRSRRRSARLEPKRRGACLRIRARGCVTDRCGGAIRRPPTLSATVERCAWSSHSGLPRSASSLHAAAISTPATAAAKIVRRHLAHVSRRPRLQRPRAKPVNPMGLQGCPPARVGLAFRRSMSTA